LWQECRTCKHLTRIIMYRVLVVGTSRIAFDPSGRHTCVRWEINQASPLHIGQQIRSC
jgi:hypothetical protein